MLSLTIFHPHEEWYCSIARIPSPFVQIQGLRQILADALGRYNSTAAPGHSSPMRLLSLYSIGWGTPQPERQSRVPKSMATLAFNPALTLNTSSGHPAPADPRSASATRDFDGMDDAAVMLELRSGNMAAFDVLLGKYRKPIIHFMYRMVHNQAVAEELAQEVFLRVYRSRETYRAEARFSTWLYRIATNLGVNHARDTRHERTASTIYLDQTDEETGSTPDVADLTPGAETRMVQDERMAAIRDYVLALPERQRTAVLMHKYEGMDYKQIGEVLKLSESATKSLLFRAYQTLRDKLKNFV